MTFAILEIRYTDNAFPTEIVPYASEQALNSRIENMKMNPQVAALITYRPSSHLTRKHVWAES